MQVQLTDSAIAAAAKKLTTGQRTELADTRLPGLRLRITAAGRRAWVLGCRDADGRIRRFPLGDYPAMGISAARDAARAARMQVKAGADPIKAARARRQRTRDAKAGVGTLAALLDRYGETEARQLKSWPDSRKRVEHVLSKLLQRPAIGLTVADIQDAIDSHPSASSAAFVVRSMRPVLKWAARAGRGWVLPELAQVVAPADGMALRRTRVLDQTELARLLPVLRTTHRPHGHALLLMLLTLARRSEIVAMRHRDVDLEAATWTLADTKNGQRHVVQLSSQAVTLLRARMAAGAAPDALVFTTGEGAALGHWDRETKAVHKASGTAGWTRHDLRRTGATMLGELGELPDIVEAALNHVSIRSPLAATYNRSRYAPAVRAALQRLADQLDQIATGAEGAAKQPAEAPASDHPHNPPA